VKVSLPSGSTVKTLGDAKWVAEDSSLLAGIMVADDQSQCLRHTSCTVQYYGKETFVDSRHVLYSI